MSDKKTADNSERVILVHGTFASSDSDCGNAWWQIDSQPYRELARRLPPRVRLAGPGEVFHWSGENHERARSKAARALLDYVKPLEEAGTPYHLIGHSHGGSVIWTALQQATVNGRKLQYLGSWTTVGTPFLQHQPRSPWSLLNLCYAFLSAFLLVPAAKTLWFLLTLPLELAFGRLDQGIIIAGEAEISRLSAILRAPIMTGLRLLGVKMETLPNGIRLGSFDPDSGQSVATFLFCTLEGWSILFGILLFKYFVLLLLSSCIAPVSEVIRNNWEKRLEQKAFDRYGSRWLAIWTPEDEAINGLRKTLDISISFLGDLTQRERIFVSDFLSLPWRPLLHCATPFYNWFIRPVLDGTIRNIVIKAAQGNNRPATFVVAVSPHPVKPPPTPTAPPLPQWLSEKILERADLHAKDLGPKLRRFLGEPIMHAGLERFNEALTGRELVHTSYFDHPEVLELLALNVSCHQAENRLRRRSSNPQLTGWFEAFRTLQSGPAEHAAISRIYPLRPEQHEQKKAA